MNKIWTQNSPKIDGYYFQKSIPSLKSVLHLLLTDLNVRGGIFVRDCDIRATHPKFLCALNFMKELKNNKEKLGEQIVSEIEQKLLSEVEEKTIIELGKKNIPFYIYSYFRLLKERPIFQNSVNQLIAQLKYIKGEIKSNYYDPYRGWEEVIEAV